MRRGGLAIVLLLAAGAPAPAQELAAASAAEVRFVDAAPSGPSVAARLAEIRQRIQEAIVYPPVARMRQLEGLALVRFEIEGDGTPSDIEVHRSSGRPTLDRAAEKAVQNAAPLPWVHGRLEVPVRFELDSLR